MVAKRKNVANELLHTEKEYTTNLGILLEVIYKLFIKFRIFLR